MSQIPPDLVEDALRGGSKLTERFCAGVWGGYGELATIIIDFYSAAICNCL